jgi:hypothetical protein
MKPPRRANRPSVSPLRLAAKLTSDRFQPGVDLSLVATITNVSNSPVKIAQDYFWALYSVTVLLPQGTPAQLTAHGRAALSVDKPSRNARQTLKPKESVVEVLPSLGRLFDISQTGRYSVTAKRVLGGRVASLSSETLHFDVL